jgi:NCAIR mutase (PurE)-related protein
MDLHTILDRFANGSLSISDLQKEISIHAIEKIDDIAKLDVNRELRKGMPEIIFAENKEYRDIIRIALAAIRRNGQVVVSRIKNDEMSKVANALKRKGMLIEAGRNSRTILVSDKSFGRKMTAATVGIMAAGTSDIGVAEEARLVAKAMGCDTIASYDVGIAGMHRLFPALKEMTAQNVGALASVVASMVDTPVVGVPTSVGYGFGGNGIAALASMLQSCTLGLAVVNIDNGVGAGAYAASIAKRMTRK